MTYSIQTKDGIVISGIPDNVPRDSQLLKDRVAQERARRAGPTAPAAAPAAAAPPAEAIPAARPTGVMPPLDVRPQVAAVEEPTATGRRRIVLPEVDVRPQVAVGVPFSVPLEAPAAPPAATAAAAPAEEEGLTAAGAACGILYGAGPTAAGAAIGAAMGAPFAGVGALPGAAAGAGVMLAADITTGLVNSVLGTNYASPTEAMQNLLARLGVEKPQTEAERIVQTVAQGAAGAIGGAGAAGTIARRLAPAVAGAATPAARVATALAERPAQQAVMGATGALAGEMAAEAVRQPDMPGAAEPAARLAGEIAGPVLAGMVARRIPGTGAVVTPAAATPERAAQVRAIAAGERAAIPVMTSDILQPGTFPQRMAQSLGEKVPFTGTGEMRKAQQAARATAVESFLRDQGARAVEPTVDIIDIAADLQRTRGVKLGDLVKKKNDVIAAVSRPDLPVDVKGTKAAVDQQVKELKNLPGPQARAAEALLVDFKNKLEGKTLAQVEELRKVVGDSLKAPELASIRTRADKAIDAIYGSLKQDMSNHIATNAGADELAKWQNANKTLSTMAKELDRFAELKTALNQGTERVGAVMTMMNSSDPKVIKKLYDNLSAQGQATMRAAIVSDVAMKSGGIDSLSPEKFLTQVKTKSKQLGVVLSPEEMQRLRNLQRALKVTARASQAAVAPPTGVQAVPFVAGGALVNALGTAGGAVAGFGAGALARAFESATVRDLLMKMPSVKPGTKAEADLVREIAVAMELAARENEPIAAPEQ